MAARLLLGVIAALRAVLIPGQAEMLLSEPLSVPAWSLQRRRIARAWAGRAAASDPVAPR